MIAHASLAVRKYPVFIFSRDVNDIQLTQNEWCVFLGRRRVFLNIIFADIIVTALLWHISIIHTLRHFEIIRHVTSVASPAGHQYDAVNEIGGTCSSQRKIKHEYVIYVRKPQGEDCVRDINRRMILKLSFEKQNVKLGIKLAHRRPYDKGLLWIKLRGLSPQANYTDPATAAVGEVVPTFAGRGCYVVSATDSHGRFSRFSRPEPLPLFSSSSSVVITRLSGPRSRSPTCQKIW
jgi:hypothetical protein